MQEMVLHGLFTPDTLPELLATLCASLYPIRLRPCRDGATEGMVLVSGAEFVIGLSPVARYDTEIDHASAHDLVLFLTAALEIPVRPISLPDYDAQIAAIREGSIDAAVLGAYAFYLARAEAGAEALAVSVETDSGEISTYQSVIIVRADSPIRALPELRGRVVGFVDVGSTAGYLLPRLLFREAGLDPDSEIIPRFLHEHAAIPDAVLAGMVDAGALHRLAFARLLAGDDPRGVRLRVIATSPPVPRGPFAVRRSLSRELRQRLLQALLRVHEAAPGGARLILAPGMRFRPASSRDVTLKTVAALAGVSYGTVSRVVNGGARVAPETHARVADVVRELGYRPNATAVGLIADRSDLIGFVVPDAADSLVAGAMVGLQRACAALDLRAVLCPTAGDRDEEARYLDLLDAGSFGGLILTAWSRDTPGVGRLAAAGRPLVLLGVPAGSASGVAVAPDIDATVALAVAHLRGLGHARLVALVPQDLADWTARQLAAGIPTPGMSQTVAVDGVEVACTAIRTALAAPERPTAVICGTERLALAVFQVAHELSIPIPGGLSVLALTESWIAAATAPPLTTVATPTEALGEYAGLLLLEQLSGGERTARSQPVPTPRVTVRASTTAAPPRV